MTNLLLETLALTLTTHLGATVRKGFPRVGQVSGEPPATSIAFISVNDAIDRSIGGVRRQWEWQCVHLAVNEDELLTAIDAVLEMEEEHAKLSVGLEVYDLEVQNLKRRPNRSGADQEEYGIDFTVFTTS